MTLLVKKTFLDLFENVDLCCSREAGVLLGSGKSIEVSEVTERI
jgi:hypothetical protein